MTGDIAGTVIRHSVDLWHWTLDISKQEIHALRALLSPEEVSRAERFVFARDADRYIAGRGRLREIVGSYLAVCPSEVRLQADRFGKPVVLFSGDESPLHFNLSHSQGLAALAVSRSGQLGIDIEKIRPIEEHVERIFSPVEQQALARLSGCEWLRGFYQCWTRKEAFVKALGRGLMIPLSDFDVTLAPSEPPKLLRYAGEPDAPLRWAFQHLEFHSGIVGALATPTAAAPVELVRRTCDWAPST